MVTTPKVEEPNLPVFGPETPIVTGHDLNKVGIEELSEGYTLPRLVRTVDILLRDLAYAPGSLEELLENAEREFHKVAKLCGALTVRPEWGLYPVDPKDPRWRGYIPANRGFGGIITLPKNHILVAEVDVIKPGPAAEESGMAEEKIEEELQNAREAITAGVQTYYEEGKGTYQLFDFRYEPARSGRSGPKFTSFEWGTRVGSPASRAERHLTDIDLRFSLTR